MIQNKICVMNTNNCQFNMRCFNLNSNPLYVQCQISDQSGVIHDQQRPSELG